MEIIKNGKVFTKNFTFEKADIILDKGEIRILYILEIMVTVQIIQVILVVVQMQITINQIIITLELSMLMA